MFRRFAQLLQKAIPLSALTATCYFSFSIPHMASQDTPRFLQSPTHLFRKNHPRIKFVRDLAEYVQKLLVRERSIILFELTGDVFIDEQVIKLAENFVDSHQGSISNDFEFIFLEEKHSLTSEEDEENYFILYGPNGEKLINIDNYINKNKATPQLKLNLKPLMKRITESLNLYREVGLNNIHTELASIENDSNYVALITTANHNCNTLEARKALKTFEKQYQVKAKNVNKFVVKDQQTKRILGLNSCQNAEQVTLLVPDSKNLRKQFKEKAQFFSINGRRCTNIDASHVNLDEVFVFPPIQKTVPFTEYVLNVYINKNVNSQQIEGSLFEELSKPQYSNYHKALYYTSDVEEAAIFYEKNDYSSECLLAYEKDTKLTKPFIKDLLTHTFQYQYPLSSKQPLDSSKLQQWIKQCQQGKAEQHFQSEKPSSVWAQQITGEEYKQVVDLPTDKVIYHYSHHCHGCKKFGGKFEEFAKNRAKGHPNLSFYRINNDNNKAEGIRNYNSTPVFVFYKKGFLNPFIYKMPIFTEQLFDAFLKITSSVSLAPLLQLENHIKQHSKAGHSVKQLLEELRV